MFQSTEFLDLYAISLRPPCVEWVDGFGGMEAVVDHLKRHPDFDRSFCVTDIGNNIRAVAFFTADGLALLTSESRET